MPVVQMKQLIYGAIALALGLVVAGCGDDEAAGGGAGGDAGSAASGGSAAMAGSGGSGGTCVDPPAYAFVSRFDSAKSSVSRGGQIWRHSAIVDLTNRIGGLTERIDKNELVPAPGNVVAELDFFLRFKPENGNQPVGLTTEPPVAQSTYDDISTDKDLIGKLAGNDDATDHKDWDDGSSFAGWPSAASPQALVDDWFKQIEANAIAHANAPRMLNGEAIPVHVTDAGVDLQQLVQKFLTGAIPYSQGTDDYLDDDVDGKGLKAENAQDADKSYTKLEHAWDEGFGYFGAAYNYDAYSDEEIAGKGGRDPFAQGYQDKNCDGAIDLKGEFNFGHSVNAAKRDLGSHGNAQTDLTSDAFSAFVAGRTGDPQRCGCPHQWGADAAAGRARQSRDGMGDGDCRDGNSLHQRCAQGHGQGR